MYRLTRHRSAYAWIACLAILFNAFAPLVSHAMQGAGPARMVMPLEICTALGMKTLPVALSSTTSSNEVAPDNPQKNMHHCGYCVFHGTAHGLPPPIHVTFIPVGGLDACPPLYYRTPRPLFPWSLAQPRAPPRLS